ncbi:MAG TPA: hypothetical protein VL326_32930 [Kofleriaceae bacterium]|nr:hypothetical protein [Kofleriaceae bacterium]
MLLALAHPADADDAPERYSRSVIARPLTLPANLISVGADAAGNHDLSTISGAPIVGFGITDKIEVQVPYAFALHDLEGRGSVAVDAGYAVVRGALDGKLEMIERVRLGYDTLGRAATPLQLGLHAQYNVTPWLAIISGTPGSEQLRVSLANDANMMKPVDIGLPLGVGVQATDVLYAQLDTKLLQIGLSESETMLVGRDMLPLTLTVVWNALSALDVQGAIATDVVAGAGDTLAFLIGARYYAGDL